MLLRSNGRSGAIRRQNSGGAHCEFPAHRLSPSSRDRKPVTGNCRIIDQPDTISSDTIRARKRYRQFRKGKTAELSAVDCSGPNRTSGHPRMNLPCLCTGCSECQLSASSGAMMQAAARRWRERKMPGSIVSIVAVVSRGLPQIAHTCAARAGVIGLTRSLAVEWAPLDIRVNCIAPGSISTEGLAVYPPQASARLRDANPLRRPWRSMGHPEASSYLSRRQRNLSRVNSWPSTAASMWASLAGRRPRSFQRRVTAIEETRGFREPYALQPASLGAPRKPNRPPSIIRVSCRPVSRSVTGRCCSEWPFDPPASRRIATLLRRAAFKVRAEHHLKGRIESQS